MAALVRGSNVLISDEKEETDIFAPVLTGPR